jgi:hypothetical protein
MNDLPFERLRSVPGRKDGEDNAGGFGSGDKRGKKFFGDVSVALMVSLSNLEGAWR